MSIGKIGMNDVYFRMNWRKPSNRRQLTLYFRYLEYREFHTDKRDNKKLLVIEVHNILY